MDLLLGLLVAEPFAQGHRRHPAGLPGLLEAHHGKTRHGQIGEQDINRTLIRIDRAHCFLEADEARMAFSGPNLYPGVSLR